MKLRLGSEKGQTSKKNNAGGHNVIFDDIVTFFRKRLFDNVLHISVMDSDGYLTEFTDDDLGENDFDVNQLNLQPGEERENIVVDMRKKGEATGKVILTFIRKEPPPGAFAGIMHVTVNKIDEFDDSAGFMDKVSDCSKCNVCVCKVIVNII